MTKNKPLKFLPVSIGNRVKSARMLCGLSRKSFALKSGISMATLRMWEEPTSGRRGLTEKGSLRLINALNQFGVHCTKEWLLEGHGLGPKIITHTLINLTEENAITWGEEESILKDIDSFKQNNPDPIVVIITDGSMLPFYSYGDYIGGNRKYGDQIRKLIGLCCICEFNNTVFIGRISSVNEENKYTLTTLNQDSTVVSPVVSNVDLKSAAEIVWHRWREKIKNVKM